MLRQKGFDGRTRNRLRDTAQQIDAAILRHGLHGPQHRRLHGRGDDHGSNTIAVTEPAQEFHAIHAGHVQIAQGQIASGVVLAGAGVEHLQCRMTIGRLKYPGEAHALQNDHRQAAGDGVVLQHQCAI